MAVSALVEMLVLYHGASSGKAVCGNRFGIVDGNGGARFYLRLAAYGCYRGLSRHSLLSRPAESRSSDFSTANLHSLGACIPLGWPCLLLESTEHSPLLEFSPV